MERGGERIIVISRRPFTLEMVRGCGASDVLLLESHEQIAMRMTTLTAGTGCERVIEAAAAQALAQDALDPAFLYTDVFPFEDAAQAFAALDRPDGFSKTRIGANNEN